ncbi:MAG: hypothetical protein E6I91_04400 [Chloroflexi bacterium]|nr:MAG: hypothetical protein E6I91_04400 [Chloroflexota bacterium]
MLSDDTTQTTGTIERVSRPYNYRNHVSERRQHILQQKQTDNLPQIASQETHGKFVWRQYMQLREENKRLHWIISKYIDEIDSMQNAHQEEVAFYKSQLDKLKTEQNRTIQDHLELERRYQELYHSFQSSVEEEAQNMVAEAARTLELHTEDGVVMTNDAMKTVKLHVRQIEEKHTAESLYLMRQAQKKAYQLEQELVNERLQIALERDSMQNQQNSLRQQTELRQQMAEDRLHIKFISTITFIATILVILLFVLQLFFLSWLHIPVTLSLGFALIVPSLLFIAVAGLIAYIRSTTRALFSIAPPKNANQKQV